MTIQEKIDALKKEFADKIAELEKQAKAEEKQSKVWKPIDGERFFYIDADGDVLGYTWEGFDDDEIYAMGNCFKNKEEAEWEKQHRIVATELERFVQENDPHPITEKAWGYGDVSKHLLQFNYNGREIDITTDIGSKKANQVYASNRDVLEKAIEHIGEERLKKYYFGVGK